MLAVKPLALENEAMNGVRMQMARQHAGFAHPQEIAPLSLSCVQHQRPEPDVGRLRYPDPFVVGHRNDGDFRRGKNMCRTVHITIHGAFSSVWRSAPPRPVAAAR